MTFSIKLKTGGFLCKCVPVVGPFQKVDNFHISYILYRVVQHKPYSCLDKC